MPSLDLAYEKLQEGAEIEPVVKGPITKEQLKSMGRLRETRILFI